VQPIPLVDLPVQLAAQMKLLARLAALYDRPAGEGGREVMASLAGGLAVRLGVQQLVKLVPISGWIASGLLGGAATVALGKAAVARWGRPA